MINFMRLVLSMCSNWLDERNFILIFGGYQFTSKFKDLLLNSFYLLENSNLVCL